MQMRPTGEANAGDRHKMSLRLQGSARAEWRAHWTVVLAAAMGAMSGSMLSYSLGVFQEPLQAAFGWSRVQIMAGPAITAIVCLVLSPFVGMQADRLGVRRLGIAGVAAIGFLMACLSLIGPGIMTWFAAWFLLAIAFCFTLPFIWTGAVSGFFGAGRGLAMGVTLCGASLSSLFVPLYTYGLIEHFGWRLAFVGLGGFILIVVLPIQFLFLSSARDHARLGKAALRTQPVVRGDWRTQMRSRQFIQIGIAALLAALVAPAVVTCAVPVLVAGGMSRAEAAGIASLIGLASISGRLGIGWALDHFDGRLIGAAVVCLPMVTAALLITVPSSPLAATVAVLFLGAALGAESDLISYVTSRYFDLGHFGKLFGVATGLVVLGGAGGPILLSAVYDHTGSYLPGLWAIIPICPVAATLFLTLGRYPAPASAPAPEGQDMAATALAAAALK